MTTVSEMLEGGMASGVYDYGNGDIGDVKLLHEISDFSRKIYNIFQREKKIEPSLIATLKAHLATINNLPLSPEVKALKKLVGALLVRIDTSKALSEVPTSASTSRRSSLAKSILNYKNKKIGTVEPSEGKMNVRFRTVAMDDGVFPTSAKAKLAELINFIPPVSVKSSLEKMIGMKSVKTSISEKVVIPYMNTEVLNAPRSILLFGVSAITRQLCADNIFLMLQEKYTDKKLDASSVRMYRLVPSEFMGDTMISSFSLLFSYLNRVRTQLGGIVMLIADVDDLSEKQVKVLAKHINSHDGLLVVLHCTSRKHALLGKVSTIIPVDVPETQTLISVLNHVLMVRLNDGVEILETNDICSSHSLHRTTCDNLKSALEGMRHYFDFKVDAEALTHTSNLHTSNKSALHRYGYNYEDMKKIAIDIMNMCTRELMQMYDKNKDCVFEPKEYCSACEATGLVAGDESVYTIETEFTQLEKDLTLSGDTALAENIRNSKKDYFKALISKLEKKNSKEDISRLETLKRIYIEHTTDKDHPADVDEIIKKFQSENSIELTDDMKSTLLKYKIDDEAIAAYEAEELTKSKSIIVKKWTRELLKLKVAAEDDTYDWRTQYNTVPSCAQICKTCTVQDNSMVKFTWVNIAKLHNIRGIIQEVVKSSLSSVDISAYSTFMEDMKL